MDFGMIPYDALTEAGFQLPEMVQPFLPGIPNQSPKVYIGLPKWTYNAFDPGKSYTRKVKTGSLAEYSKHFNAIELNATNYNIPEAAKATGWYDAIVRNDFQFCPKFYKGFNLTEQGYASKDKMIADFIESLHPFKDKLGPAFLLMRDHFTPERSDDLLCFIERLPKDFKLAVELRNPQWFENNDHLKILAGKLNERNASLVITDSPGRRDVAHMQLSNGTAFIRFVCLGNTTLDECRIKAWKQQLQNWFDAGLQKCYFFLHIHKDEYLQRFSAFVKEELQF